MVDQLPVGADGSIVWLTVTVQPTCGRDGGQSEVAVLTASSYRHL
ncbi:hypothetical protein K2D_23420 [Planctomycetes bacterium K2D]|uniref:Uncharacterized protein n=1 Tax=Botrimarina mediterranea TaxID=2528022 RepID=A0A518K8J1_9BACT|nr:hypothetical protein Spa11_23040 [Botrimarina mediterranea]QDV78735.1 hypothetical protein K2D_23420 [Planctomycetes bacterium K2D]